MENKVDSPRTPAATPERLDSPVIKENKGKDLESPRPLGSPKVDAVQGGSDGEKSEIEEDNTEEKKDVAEDGEVGDSSKDGNMTPRVEYSLENAFEDIDNFLSRECSDDSSVLVVPDFVNKFLDLLEAKIVKYTSDSTEGKAKWCANVEEDSAFLESVHRLSQVVNSLDPSKLGEESGPVINRIESIKQRAMSFLEDEFRSLLNECKPLELDTTNNEEKSQSESSDSADQEASFRGFPPEVVSNLNKIAGEMMFGGFETECCQVYIVGRNSYFDELLVKLGFESISIDEVQKMQWEALEREIAKWVKVYRECAKIHFVHELKLVESVFADHKSVARLLFDNLSRSVIVHILNFAEAVSMISKRSAEKVFKFLDLYETLRETEPTMDELFADLVEPHDCKTEIMIARSRIGEAILCMFCDLENSIKSDASKNVVPGGAVHPLTRYTMNYLEYACEYKDTIEHVFKEHLKIERADSNNRSEYPGDTNCHQQNNNNSNQQVQSPFLAQLLKVMELLDSYLEAKSKLYKDVSLCSIFMMNNGRYILQKVRGSPEIKVSIGDMWSRKKSSDLRQYHQNYKRETWGKVLGCLKDEGLTVNGKVNKPELKERFKSFNAVFDEIHKTQSSWIISDEQLQSELRVSIAAVVVPAYRSFLGRFSQVFTPGRQTEKYVKYQPEDLETYIDELFDGNSAGKRRS